MAGYCERCYETSEFLKTQISSRLAEALWELRFQTGICFLALVSLTTLSVIQTVEFIMISQWSRGLSFGSAAAHLQGLRFRIPLGPWVSISCECCVLSCRGLCDGSITRPEEFYRVWCVCVCVIVCDQMQYHSSETPMNSYKRSYKELRNL
jgi:hypothetical protein